MGVERLACYARRTVKGCSSFPFDAFVAAGGIRDKAMFAPIWELAFLNGHGPRVAESGPTLSRGAAPRDACVA